MNLELIIKLTKLANNNPNDHEANFAARKVCKLIEDGSFNFIEDAPVSNQEIPNYDSTWFHEQNVRSPIWDYIKNINNKAKQEQQKQREQNPLKCCTGCGNGITQTERSYFDQSKLESKLL